MGRTKKYTDPKQRRRERKRERLLNDPLYRETKNQWARNKWRDNPEYRAIQNYKRTIRRHENKKNDTRKRHGLCGTGAWKSWWFMKQRVLNSARKDNLRYKDHHIDPRWMVFENFFADMGVRPEGMTLERIDNTKGYSPENCKWETMLKQSRNRKTNKLTEEKAKEIRSMYFEISNPILAKKYGVTVPSIWAVKHGRSWKEVAHV